MNLDQRIEAFSALGNMFSKLSGTNALQDTDSEDKAVMEAFLMQIERAAEYNGWFTKDNVLHAFRSWGASLRTDELNHWLGSYTIDDTMASKTIGIIMAGNIPLVGFHDFLSSLITGHKVVVKLSSNDPHFIPLVARYLSHKHPYFKEYIKFTSEKLEGFDAVIATGSNNTSRYFEHYFGAYPNIIRKNRNAVAILTGNETKEELELLGEDIFRYFGLGCRSVSKIYVPKNYDFDLLFGALYKFNDIINYKKYENNYDYNKAVYLMSLFPILENGFVMLKEDSGFSSPIATLFYEYYESTEELMTQLRGKQDNIQCIVSNENFDDFVNFGNSQSPKLWNYADGVDTIKFLINL
jgi:hypothetical protein